MLNFDQCQEIIRAYKDGLPNWQFVRRGADCSRKQYFQILNKDGESIGVLLLDMSNCPPSDEEFSYMSTRWSQAECFYEAYQQLGNVIPNNVPCIYATFDSIILIENIMGDAPVKASYPHIVNNILKKIRNIPMDDAFFKFRHFDEATISHELEEYVTWYLGKMCGLNEQEIDNARKDMDYLAKTVANLPQDVIHRDFQSRNILMSNQHPYVIDFQDLCIGPKYYDLVALVFDANMINDRGESLLSQEEIIYLISLGCSEREKEISPELWEEIMVTALQRVLKNMGRHAKYFIRDGRQESGNYVRNNEIMLTKLRELQRDNTLHSA